MGDINSSDMLLRPSSYEFHVEHIIDRPLEPTDDHRQVWTSENSIVLKRDTKMKGKDKVNYLWKRTEKFLFVLRIQ